jgi:hypothetical protein
LGAFHAGTVPTGVYGLPEDAPFMLDPPIPLAEYELDKPVKGVLLGMFGKGNEAECAVVVNLDYKNPAEVTVKCKGKLEVYDAMSDKWVKASTLRLVPGGGKLVRSVGT